MMIAGRRRLPKEDERSREMTRDRRAGSCRLCRIFVLACAA